MLFWIEWLEQQQPPFKNNKSSSEYRAILNMPYVQLVLIETVQF